MKKWIIVPIVLLICSYLVGQHPPQEIVLKDGRSFLVGKIEAESLQAKPYQTWYNKNFNAYSVDTETIKSLKDDLNPYHILVFMGTWCGDSKREVPRFLKLLEAADFPSNQLKIVAVDRRKEFYKKSPSGEEWGLDIRRVPTFIFLKDGKEANRIVESPVVSLEKDILAIVGGQKYVPNYSLSD
ncbi:MAG: thioredoxin family protein [Flavobacteriaceae bacterium]